MLKMKLKMGPGFEVGKAPRLQKHESQRRQNGNIKSQQETTDE
jgi:hypothetical protein